MHPVANTALLAARAMVPLEVTGGFEAGLDGAARRLGERRWSTRRGTGGGIVVHCSGLEAGDVCVDLRLGALVGSPPLGTPVFRQLGPGAVSHGVRLV